MEPFAMCNAQKTAGSRSWVVAGGQLPGKARAKADMLHRNTSIPLKAGQPTAAVRFLDMQDKSH